MGRRSAEVTAARTLGDAERLRLRRSGPTTACGWHRRTRITRQRTLGVRASFSAALPYFCTGSERVLLQVDVATEKRYVERRPHPIVPSDDCERTP
jgi:hypothetical protein